MPGGAARPAPNSRIAPTMALAGINRRWSGPITRRTTTRRTTSGAIKPTSPTIPATATPAPFDIAFAAEAAGDAEGGSVSMDGDGDIEDVDVIACEL